MDKDDGLVVGVDSEKLLECTDCKRQFLFTLDEQQFYAKNNLLSPKRCRVCRNKKKEYFKEYFKEARKSTGGRRRLRVYGS